MQPYLFPYIGYFQLINSVDYFVLLDDVNYINKGYVNRNSILINGSVYNFTLPLSGASQNLFIREIKVTKETKYLNKLFKTICLAYSKSPFYKNVIPLIESVVFFDDRNLSSYIHNSLSLVCNYLDISTKIIPSSTIFENIYKSGQERIINITRQLKVKEYINPIGGASLYDYKLFKKNGIQLKFLKTNDDLYYKQLNNNNNFTTNLSIIDALMHNSKNELSDLLNQCKLI